MLFNEMSNQVLVSAYIKLNFGDDLFLDALFKRYSTESFYVIAEPEYKAIFQKYENVSVIEKNLIYKMINRILKCMGTGLFKLIASRSACAVLIGGSLFMEPSFPSCEVDNTPLFIVGANYGPEKTLSYREKCAEYFLHSADVCLRDSNSYSYFSTLPNVRVASDVLFSLDYARYINEGRNNKVFVSVIDITEERRTSISQYRNPYMRFLKNEITRHVRAGRKVVISSFCSYEGDELACQGLLSQLDSDIKGSVETCLYDGDLDKVLFLIGSSDYVIGTRFHSIVVALAMGKRVAPLSYSPKTENMLSDIGIDAIHLSDLSQHFDDDQYVSINQDRIISLRSSANLQFKKLDSFLGAR